MKKFLSFFALLLTLAVAMPALAGGLGLVQPGTEPGFVAEEAVLGTVPMKIVWIVVGPGETVNLGFTISGDQAAVAQQRLNALTGYNPEECVFHEACAGLTDGDLLICVMDEYRRCRNAAPVRILSGGADPSSQYCENFGPFCYGAKIINRSSKYFTTPMANIFRQRLPSESESEVVQ